MIDLIFYSIDVRTPESLEKMRERFEKLSLKVGFCQERCSRSEECKVRVLKDFLSSTKDYAVIFKGDIHLHKNLSKELESILLTMKSMDLDLLLLGYFTSTEISPWSKEFPLLTQMGNRRYHFYPTTLTNSSLFIVSRDYALNYLASSSYTTGKRALIFPVYALEENANPVHLNNTIFSQKCYFCNYFPDQFY